VAPWLRGAKKRSARGIRVPGGDCVDRV